MMFNKMLHFSKNIYLGDKEISEQSPVFIIAEAGVNHGGDMSVARQLIDIAAGSGADAVKFQAFRTEQLIIDDVDKAPYQKNTTGTSESQAEMLKKLELQNENYIELMEYCKLKGIIFLITPFDEQSLQELEGIGVDAYKVASTDTTNLPFLKKIAQTGKPIIFSTGMCYLNEVTAALEEIKCYNDQVIILQCTANYPIKDSEANLNVLRTYQEHYDAILGYSDHSVGLGAALYSIPLGAKVVEKHFTIDKGLDGPDHEASLDPEELKEFVKQARTVEAYLGATVKEPTASELLTRASLQKCLVASCTICEGETFTEENIVAKRTGGKGITPLYYKDIVGKVAQRGYVMNDIIESDFE